ncbi:MAG: 50S ribosomal protein L13 [candidate division Zixibacteria bacterium]|nr:50S ribosomal protein L13 [candidate division Zixibacteria bacterium]
MKTPTVRQQDVQHNWHVVDASGMVLGRLASAVAQILRGKHKPLYAPDVDNGDHVIVVNASKIRVTGNKAQDKLYRHHSGYPGGLKTVSYEQLFSRNPERVVRMAIKGMLPHNILGRQMYRKLRVYNGAAHPHDAQRPESKEL